MERRDTHARHARFEQVRNDVAKRLRPACAHIPEDEFAALVDRMTTIHLKYLYRRVVDLFPEPLDGPNR